jgi:hypothetical protein
MKKLLLTCLLLSFLSTKCSNKDTLQCSDCYDLESVLEAANKTVAKRFGNLDNCEIIIIDEADLKDANRMAELEEQLEKIDNCEIIIIDKTDFYTITYAHNDPLIKGGGVALSISKKDCKIVDYIIYP